MLPHDRATGSFFQQDFPAEEFAERRERVFEAIGEDACALLQGAPEPRGFALFRQSNEFYYLSGLETSRALLLLDGRNRTTRAYLPRVGEGRHHVDVGLGAEHAALIEGALGLAVHPSSELEADLAGATVLYTPHAPAEGLWGSRDVCAHGDRLAREDPWDGAPSREQRLIGLLGERCPGAEVRDLSPILDAMRRVKSPRELALVRRASRLSAIAVLEAMRATRPGMAEYQLAAILHFVFRNWGARYEGYREIIPAGPRIVHGHYGRNDALLADGDLVLMDGAPDIGNYTADIGRMWPVNGTYAPWQRELYGFVVDYHKALLAAIRPGRRAGEIMDEIAEAFRPVVEATAWSKPAYRAAAERFLSFRGHLSHPVGLAVHDVGPYEPYPLEPGVVFTVDPQLWVPEEQLYIRVEDTVEVTAAGMESLTREAPLDLDDVEAAMREPCRFPVEG